jgi:hypothetical protein
MNRIVKSFFLPRVSVNLTKVDIANRFILYGQICRIDFCRDDGFVGNVFIHFLNFDEYAEDGYLYLQHEQSLPAYLRVTDEYSIQVLPYKSVNNHIYF